MKRVCMAFAGIFLVGAFTGSAAAADTYFPGKWAYDDPNGCGRADGEFLMFEADGSFRIQRFGRAELVGFWSEADNVLTLEALSAPKRQKPRLPTFNSIFAQNSLAVELQERGQGFFTATATLNYETATIQFHRCKD